MASSSSRFRKKSLFVFKFKINRVSDWLSIYAMFNAMFDSVHVGPRF